MIDKVNRLKFDLEPNRYTLVKGDTDGAPLCPYGNHYRWIGFDKKDQSFVRVTKSVFKSLIAEKL